MSDRGWRGWSFVAGLVLAVFPAGALAALSGKDIMQRNEEARRVQDISSDAVIATSGGGQERIKGFSWWRKLGPDGVRFNTFTRFRTPAEVRGEGILFLERDNGEADVLLYLPSFRKIRRVESQQQSGSFMGSEFSYSDIATPHVDDYSYQTRADEPCAGGALKCRVVEATPATDAVRERTGYSRSVLWVRPDNFMAERGEYYDVEGALWKKMTATEIREIDPGRHKWLAHQVRLENVKTGRRTELKFSNVKANAGIPDSVFTQRNLSEGR